MTARYPGVSIAEYSLAFGLIALICVVPLSELGEGVHQGMLNLQGLITREDPAAVPIEAGSDIELEALDIVAGTSSTADFLVENPLPTPEALAHMIEITGTEGSLDNLLALIHRLHDQLQAEGQSEEANMLLALANSGRDISQFVRQSKADIAYSAGEQRDWDGVLDASETSYLDELPNPATMQTKITDFQKLARSALNRLSIKAPQYKSFVNQVSSEIVVVSDGFNAQLAEIRQPVQEALTAETPPDLRTLFQNRLNQLDAIDHSTADYVTQRHSDTLEATGDVISYGTEP